MILFKIIEGTKQDKENRNVWFMRRFRLFSKTHWYTIGKGRGPLPNPQIAMTKENIINYMLTGNYMLNKNDT